MAEDDPPVPVLIGGVDEALGLCCSGSQRLESAEVREWHKSLTWRGHSLRRKRASLTAEVRFSSKRLGPRPCVGQEGAWFVMQLSERARGRDGGPPIPSECDDFFRPLSGSRACSKAVGRTSQVPPVRPPDR